MIILGHFAFGFVIGWIARRLFQNAAGLFSAVREVATVWRMTALVVGATIGIVAFGAIELPIFMALPGPGLIGLVAGAALQIGFHRWQLSVAAHASGSAADGYD